jgi:type 1 glutamine amidotransferase
LPLPGDSQPPVLGQVLTGMKFDDKPVEGSQNNPMMPIAWTRTYEGAGDETGRAFCSTIGAATDLEAEGTRRLIVNACYWAAGLESRIPEKSNVELVGEYKPSPFKFGGFKPGLKPADHELK